MNKKDLTNYQKDVLANLIFHNQEYSFILPDTVAIYWIGEETQQDFNMLNNRAKRALRSLTEKNLVEKEI